MARSVAVVVLTLLVVGSALGSVGVVAGQSDQAGGEISTTTATDLSLDQLRPNGQRPANAPDSVRPSGTYGEYAVEYLPTGLLVDSSQDSHSWRYLAPSTTIKRDSIRLLSKRGYGLGEKPITIRVAYWDTGNRRVGNGTQQRGTVATNVTTHSISSSLSGGYDYVEIPLISHFDDGQETTVCVEEQGDPNCLQNPGTARWRFTHATSAAAQTVSYDTAGGQIAFAIAFLTIPFAVTSAGTLWVSRRMIREAKAGPRISILVWLGVLVALIVALGVFWDAVVSTLVAAPWMLAIVVGILIGVLASEWFGDGSYLALFMRLRLDDVADDGAFTPHSDETDVITTTGEADSGQQAAADGGQEHSKADLLDTPGRLVADAVPLRMARSNDGSRARVGQGFWKFLARARGARADLEVDGNISTRVDIEEGPYRELYLLDPEDDDPIDYEGEGHRFDWPEIVSRDEHGNRNYNIRALLGGGLALGLSYAVGSALLSNGVLGLAIGGTAMIVIGVLKPDPGHLKANLAPVHYGNALAGLFSHAEAIGEARTWEDLFDEVTKEKAENKAEKQEIADRRTTSQAETIMENYVDEGAEADD